MLAVLPQVALLDRVAVALAGEHRREQRLLGAVVVGMRERAARLADDLLAAVAEDPLGRGVHVEDAALAVEQDDPVRNRLDDLAVAEAVGGGRRARVGRHVLVDELEQPPDVDRLRQHLDAVAVCVSVRGDEHDRHVAVEPLDELVARAVGKVDVGEDEIRLLVEREAKAVRDRRRGEQSRRRAAGASARSTRRALTGSSSTCRTVGCRIRAAIAWTSASISCSSPACSASSRRSARSPSSCRPTVAAAPRSRCASSAAAACRRRRAHAGAARRVPARRA